MQKNSIDANYRSILLIFSVLLFIAGCRATEDESVPDEIVTIRFACHEHQLSDYDDLAKQFEAKNPGIKLHLTALDEMIISDPEDEEEIEDIWQQLAGSADTLCVRPNLNATKQGLVRDLTPFIQQDPNFQREDFYPGALETLQWTGGTWALPGSVDFNVIFYDQAAFDAAGVSYPEPGWTWQDFSEKAMALTERIDDETVRWGFVQPQGMSLLISRAGPLFDETADPPLPRLDSPPVIEAVQWYTDLHLKHQLMPFFPRAENRATLPESQLIIDQGKAAMWADIAGSFEWRSRQRDLGMVPFSVKQAQDLTTPTFASQAFLMSAGTAYPNESWRWLTFLTQHPAPQSFGLTLPARRSAAEATGFWDTLDEALRPTYRFALEHPRRPVGVDLAHFYDAVESILAGRQDVTPALAEAQAQTRQALLDQAQRLAEATPPVPIIPTPLPEDDERVIIFAPAFGNSDNYRDLAQAFNEAQSVVTVEVRQPRFQHGFGLKDMAAASDCFTWFPADRNELQQYALNLTPFLEAESRFPLNDFYPQVLEAFHRQNELWAVPADVQIQLLFYNRDLFDAANITYPQPGWTLNEFLTKASDLTQGEGEKKQFGYLPLGGNASDLLTFIALSEATWIDDQFDPARFRFNDPALAEVIQWHIDLAQIHQIVPVFEAEDPADPTTTAILKRRSLIQTGKAAMWIGTFEIRSFFVTPPDMNIGIVPLPLDQATYPFISSLGYYISKESIYPQHCWAWINFLTEESLAAAANLPPRRSITESDAFRAKVGDDVADAYLFSIEQTLTNRALTSIFADLGIQWLFEAYGQAVAGVSVSTALDQAQAKAQIFFACLDAEGDIENKEVHKRCAKKADPDLVWPGEPGT